MAARGAPARWAVRLQPGRGLRQDAVGRDAELRRDGDEDGLRTPGRGRGHCRDGDVDGLRAAGTGYGDEGAAGLGVGSIVGEGIAGLDI